MYNYNRDVYQAEHERFERMMTARQRQVPTHLRRSARKQVSRWLASRVGEPASAMWSSNSASLSHRLGVWYRRASTRVVGLVLNTLEGLLDLAPDRA